MRKSLIYVVIGSIIAVIAATLWLTFSRSKLCIENILVLHQDDGKYSNLVIDYPLDETLFPPEIVAPSFYWSDDNPKSNKWLVTIRFQDDKGPRSFLCSEPK